MSINLRVKQVRKHFKLSQTAFGEKMSVSRDVINDVENQRVVAKELFLQHLCTVFQVNERWLHDGEGEMFIETDRTIISNLVKEYNLDSLDEKIIASYLQLSPLQRKIMKNYLKDLVSAMMSDENYNEFYKNYIKDNSKPVGAQIGEENNLSK